MMSSLAYLNLERVDALDAVEVVQPDKPAS
jgi:hypothetical protein